MILEIVYLDRQPPSRRNRCSGAGLLDLWFRALKFNRESHNSWQYSHLFGYLVGSAIPRSGSLSPLIHPRVSYECRRTISDERKRSGEPHSPYHRRRQGGLCGFPRVHQWSRDRCAFHPVGQSLVSGRRRHCLSGRNALNHIGPFCDDGSDDNTHWCSGPISTTYIFPNYRRLTAAFDKLKARNRSSEHIRRSSECSRRPAIGWPVRKRPCHCLPRPATPGPHYERGMNSL